MTFRLQKFMSVSMDYSDWYFIFHWHTLDYWFFSLSFYFSFGFSRETNKNTGKISAKNEDILLMRGENYIWGTPLTAEIEISIHIKSSLHHLESINTGKWRLDTGYNVHIRRGNNLLFYWLSHSGAKSFYCSLFTELSGSKSVMGDFKLNI